MKRVFTLVTVLALCVLADAAFAEHRIAWSHYTGWEPYGYMQDEGIMKKWADKYGIEVEIILINDYIESINQYTAGAFDGCVMTNMDALTIPAVGGVDSTVLIVGDFSNGNDGIVGKNIASVADLKGREVRLVELSVSHYLLARALEKSGLRERDLQLVNTSDADIAAVYATDAKGIAVTWNPILMQVRQLPGTKMVYDSSQIPGEIIDCLVVRTDLPETVKKALVGAWYETMGIMNSRNKENKEAIQFMANQAGGTEPEFKMQLRTTAMFYAPADGAKFARGEATALSKPGQLKETMEYVRQFVFDKGLFEGADTADVVGVGFPDGSITGDKGNVKLRFDAEFMQMAADGKL